MSISHRKLGVESQPLHMTDIGQQLSAITGLHLGLDIHRWCESPRLAVGVLEIRDVESLACRLGLGDSVCYEPIPRPRDKVIHIDMSRHYFGDDGWKKSTTGGSNFWCPVIFARSIAYRC